MCNCGDYEPPEFFRENKVKARKPHRCCECLRTIERGETYQKVCGKWDGSFDTYETCLGCLDLARSVGVTCWGFGDLIDCFSEADGSPELSEWMESREQRRLAIKAEREEVKA
jgi:hypothetical protein